MSELTGDYFILVFTGALGVLQVAAAYSRLDGLLFIRHRSLAAGLGVVVAIGAFVWFFASEPRNIPDTAGGLDGNKQTVLFAAAAWAAVGATLVASSLINWRRGNRMPLQWGLGALGGTTYIQALLRGFAEWRRRWREWMHRYSSG